MSNWGCRATKTLEKSQFQEPACDPASGRQLLAGACWLWELSVVLKIRPTTWLLLIHPFQNVWLKRKCTKTEAMHRTGSHVNSNNQLQTPTGMINNYILHLEIRTMFNCMKTERMSVKWTNILVRKKTKRSKTEWLCSSLTEPRYSRTKIVLIFGEGSFKVATIANTLPRRSPTDFMVANEKYFWDH